jgi:nucleoside phosphorylase
MVNASAVILTAVDEEYTAVVRALGDGVVRTWQGAKLYASKVGDLDVLVVPMGAMGNTSSAQAATAAISVWNPAFLFLVGILGGVPDTAHDLRLGDVVVADQIVGYEQATARPGRLERRYQVLPVDWTLLQAARGVEQRDWALSITTERPDGHDGRVIPRAFVGYPVFSGEKVVADDTTVRQLLKEWHQAMGIEMEGLGVAVASYRNGPRFLIVKAVSDFTNPGRNYDWHAYAAESAARFVVALLGSKAIEPDRQRPQAIPESSVVRFSGTVKVQFCRRLHDSWMELADLFEVPLADKARFQPGNESRQLWEWLEMRDKLAVVPDMLVAIGRPDVADLLRNDR